jgi:hypothetical protein
MQETNQRKIKAAQKMLKMAFNAKRIETRPAP